MIPTPGRIVEYTLSEQDAEAINRRRRHATTSGLAKAATGVQLHVGNEVAEGDTYPMVIVRVWGDTETSSVNGRVLLDGTDDLWATSVGQGDGPRTWRPYQRIGA